VSIERTKQSEASEKIAVAVAVDDADLRRRVLQALDASARSILTHDIEFADVMISDRLFETDVPTIVVGKAPMVGEAIRRGYAGALLSSSAGEKLVIAIAAVAYGLICRDAAAEPAPALDDETGSPELTLREAEVLQLLMTGASNKDIARHLHISVHTAKFHVASIIGKFGATGRTDAVARALRSARTMI
jgi:DNA-binding CsgD family transcriptional regulator